MGRDKPNPTINTRNNASSGRTMEDSAALSNSTRSRKQDTIQAGRQHHWATGWSVAMTFVISSDQRCLPPTPISDSSSQKHLRTCYIDPTLDELQTPELPCLLTLYATCVLYHIK
ncbi:hypothetical protein VTN77DRAFT_230 [Rasamsonia byssochlamydoides]|uniref:uncharacterized protein n=1 Tax=Rasamsonia byssochlamydoides TaxID=89139 RepID=UPI0037441A28